MSEEPAPTLAKPDIPIVHKSVLYKIKEDAAGMIDLIEAELPDTEKHLATQLHNAWEHILAFERAVEAYFTPKNQ